MKLSSYLLFCAALMMAGCEQVAAPPPVTPKGTHWLDRTLSNSSIPRWYLICNKDGKVAGNFEVAISAWAELPVKKEWGISSEHQDFATANDAARAIAAATESTHICD